MKPKNKEIYDRMVNNAKKKYGFLPEDFEETLRCMIEALEEYEFI